MLNEALRIQPVSVAMATLNGEAFVEEQLDSIARQTLLPAELQVGDDGSGDGTLGILERFARTAPFPVHITANPVRLGAPANFLAICARTRGPIVALADWDDVWHPSKLERTARWFADPRVGLVVHRSEVVDAELRSLGRRYPAIRRSRVHAPRRVDPWMAVPGMAMVFRKRLLDAVAQLPIERPAEATGMPLDHDDWIYHVAGALSRTVFLAEDLMRYRQHGRSYMGAPGAGLVEQSQRGLRLDDEALLGQAAMFRARRDFWLRLSGNVDTPGDIRWEAARAAAWCAHLARLQAARAAVRASRVPRAARAGRIARLLARGAYRPRSWAGLGFRAFAADAASLAIGGARHGGGAPLDDGLARRIARERSAGQSPAALARTLTDEGLSPPYGPRWTDEMIRDLVYRGRRAIEMDALEGRSGPTG